MDMIESLHMLMEKVSRAFRILGDFLRKTVEQFRKFVDDINAAEKASRIIYPKEYGIRSANRVRYLCKKYNYMPTIYKNLPYQRRNY